MNVLVIHNKLSGYSDSRIFDFVRNYAEDGDSITIRTFNGSTPFEELCKGAEEFDFVVVSGGDGTISTVTYLLRYTDIPILPFPAGTSNLLATNLYSPNEPHALVKLCDQANTEYFDIGEIEVADKKFGFAIMSGCGWDALIMKRAANNKAVLGPVAYFEAGVHNALPPTSEFTLTIDGEVIKSSGMGIVLINFSKIQFDIAVSEQNLPNDGMLDVAVLKTKNAFEIVPVLLSKMIDHSGELTKKIGGMEVFRGREITIDADPAMILEFDGEPTAFTTPFTARCLPNAVRYIVSEECSKVYAKSDSEG